MTGPETDDSSHQFLSAGELRAAYRRHLQEQGRRPATVATYDRVLRIWLDHLARQRPPVPWREAGPEQLRALLDGKPHGRGTKRRRGVRLAESTRWQYHKVIRGVYAWATDEGHLEADPMRKLAHPRRPDPIPRALDLEQVGQLLEHAADDQRLQVAIWLAFGLGLRRAEIAAARVEDLRLGGRRPAMTVHGKGGKTRVVPIPQVVRPVLAAFVAGRPRCGPLLDSLRRPEGITAHAVGQMIAHAMADAGIAETAHALRHTYAVELLAADEGRNLRAVSRLLGHSSVATTEKFYTGVYDHDADLAVALLPDPRTTTSWLEKKRTDPDFLSPPESRQHFEPSTFANGELTPEVATWAARLEAARPGLLDQLAACLADLQEHAPIVARAMAAANQLTHAFCEAFHQIHDDPWSLQADDDREKVEDGIGVSRLWDLADLVRDAHPDFAAAPEGVTG